MSVANRDASLTTARRRQIVTYGWRKGVGLYTDPTLTKSEQAPSNAQGGGPSADVPLNVFIGAQLVGQTADACACNGGSATPTTQGFVKEEGGTCNPANNGGS